MGQFDGYNTGVFRKAGAFGRAQALYLCTEKKNRGWEKEILVRCQVPHVAKIINSPSFWRNNILYLEKLPHSHQAPTGEGGGRENNGTYKEQAAPILPLLFATCCILGLPLMQAGANSFQESWQTMNFHQKTELTFSNFLSGQRAENTSFAGSVCRVGALIFGCGGSVLASFGDSTWYQEFFGSIPPPHPSHLQQFTASASCSLSKPMEPHDPSHRQRQLQALLGQAKATNPLQGCSPSSSKVTGLQGLSKLPADEKVPSALQGLGAHLSHPELVSKRLDLSRKG